MPYAPYANKRILVVGLGRSGVAVARFLARCGARVTATDLATQASLEPSLAALAPWDIRFTLGRHAEEDFVQADLIVLSPGVPHSLPVLSTARASGVPVIGEMGLAAGLIREPVLAVTGTNGKTTTTKLVAAMLEQSGKRVFLGGNIGTPLISYVDRDETAADVVVVEVSSFQLDTAPDFHPQTAVMLNISDDHLDRYENRSAYIQAKWRIFANQGPSDTAVLNGMDAAVCHMLETFPPRAACSVFSDRSVFTGARILPREIVLFDQGRRSAVFSLARCDLFGPHNRENIAAACLAASHQGASRSGIQRAIDAVKGLAHRLEPAGRVGSVRFFNDSKATNVDAVRRALACFDEPVVLIMGGQNKKGDFSRLRASVRRHVRTLVVLGAAKTQILDALGDSPQQGAVEADALQEAVEMALASAASGGTVLFSPACASFDMFENYAQRGDRFKEIVKGLQ